MRGLRDVGKDTVSREPQSPDATVKAAVEASLNKCRAGMCLLQVQHRGEAGP
jgi:hypothetical protein